MEAKSFLRVVGNLSEKISSIRSAEDAHKIVCAELTRCFDLNYCSVYSKEEGRTRFKKKYEQLPAKNLKHTKLPDHLKCSDELLKSADCLLHSGAHPSPFYEEKIFSDGTDIIMTVRIDAKIELIVLGHKKKNSKINAGHAELTRILSNFYAQVIKSDILRREINKRQKELSAKVAESTGRLQILNDKLKKSNEELQQFAYSTSHDLQEPLRMITNYIDLFVRYYGKKIDTEGKEFLNFAREGARRMHTLIKDLLTYSRLDYTEEPMETFEGSRMLEEALQNLRLAMEENNALIFYQNMPVLYGNKSQIVRLFQNLVDNAIKFKGHDIPAIFIDVQEDKHKWKFKVRDNGIGIDPEFHEKIFGFFSRLHARDEFNGSGLGLSICRKIVERHSGNIGVESEDGKGSTFYFTIQKSAVSN